ncbi:MAG: hypothetical protein QXK12_08700 [Candidatus Nezhaarchaeales archaeon]
MCGKEIKDVRGLGPHMRIHKRNPPPVPPPPAMRPPLTPGGFGGAGPSFPASNQPPLQGGPTLDPALLMGLLSNLMGGGRKDPAEEAFREAYTKFIKAVAELPSSFMLGMQSGLKEAVKSYVKEELKEVREEIGKFIEEARSKAARERSAERSGKKVEG